MEEIKKTEAETLEFYKNEVKVDEWLNQPFKNTIIKFRDRVEYKKNGAYHRLNGPAIEYPDDSEKSKYYYRGVLYEDIELWKKDTTKELRKLKIKKINESGE